MSQPNVANLSDIKVHMPMLLNFEKKSPLHISVVKEDFKTVEAFLKYL